MNKRFETLDTYRGIVIVNMIAYHFLYDVFVIFGNNGYWHRNPGVHAWQQFICCSFIILSGFVWAYGKKKNLKRGIFINLLGLVITAFTLIFAPGEVVWFGILNFLGCAILLTFPVDAVVGKLTKHTSKNIPETASKSSVDLSPSKNYIFYWTGLILSIALFLLLRNMNSHTFGFGPCTFGQIPDMLYQWKVLIPFGFPTNGFRSSDYFSIFPWFFLYLFGYFLGRILESTSWFEEIGHLRIPVLNWMGRKSIWIYMIHQVICYGICLLLFG